MGRARSAASSEEELELAEEAELEHELADREIHRLARLALAAARREWEVIRPPVTEEWEE